MSESYAAPIDIRPVPDPTVLTTAQLHRELGMLRELIEARLAGMDKTHILLQETVRLLAAEEDAKRLGLKELFGEKFNGIYQQFQGVALQFSERDVRAEAAERAAKEAAAAQAMAANTAVNAALQAQKESAFATQQSNAEAIRKSEAGFNNEINSLKALINSTKETLAATVGDLRSRLDRGEGSDRGQRQARTEDHMTMGSVVNIVVAVAGVVSLVAAIVFGISNMRLQQQPEFVAPPVVPAAPH